MDALSQTATSVSYPVKDLIKIFKWARNEGATQIRAHGIEIDFEKLEEGESLKDFDKRVREDRAFYEKHGFSRSELTYSPDWSAYHAMKAQAEADEVSQSTESNPPAITSVKDDPDVYARNSDTWANQTRLPRR